jgi:hypothetical protein
MSSAEKTTDHETIKAWVEERGGRPARVAKSSGGKEDKGGGILRIDFQEPDESLEEITWEEFFEIFEENKLAFLHQDQTSSGKTSRFVKFVNRD